MPFLTTMGMLLGGASAIKGFIGGDKMERAGRKTLNELRDVEFQNAYANLTPSLKAEETLFGLSGRRMGGVVDVAQGMNAADAMGMINTAQGGLNEMESAGIQSILDKNYEADKLRAGDEVRIQGMEFQRNRALRNEAISQINAGGQMQMSALEGAAGLAISAGTAQTAAAAEGGTTPKALRQAGKQQKLAGRYTNLGGKGDTKGKTSGQLRNMIHTQRGTKGGFFKRTGEGIEKAATSAWGWLSGLFG